MSICQSIDSNDKEWIELTNRLLNNNTFLNPSAEVQKMSVVNFLQTAKRLLSETRNNGKLKHALCAEIYIDFAIASFSQMCEFHEEDNMNNIGQGKLNEK